MNDYLTLGITIFAVIFGWAFTIILIKDEIRNRRKRK